MVSGYILVNIRLSNLVFDLNKLVISRLYFLLSLVKHYKTF